MDRDDFLARVGQASMTSHLPAPPDVASELPEYVDVDLTAHFRAKAQAVNAVVHGPVARHAVPKTVAGIAAGHEARSFVTWDDLPVSGVPSALVAEGLVRFDPVTPRDDRLEHNLGYISLDVGVTGADAGFAQSGSLVLSHGAGRPRMASLIPEIHIALLDVDTITTGLAHWAHEYPEIVADTTNLVFITGPSRTGDIEQQLNLGVHGPRHVHIVMIK